MTMNVRGLFKSHWDLRHTIATHNLDILVLTETKLTKSRKPRTWMEHLLKGFKWWSKYDRSGGTIICVRESVALATHCTSALLNSDGRIASVVLKGRDTNLLLIGTYWPSSNSADALACRSGMQLQNEFLISSHSNCTPLVLGDMNATLRDNDCTSGAMYPSDRRYSNFLNSNNLTPCMEDSIRPWTHCQATGRYCNDNTTYTFSRIDDIILPNHLATQCPPCHTCELGYLSDHIPLLMTIPTSTLKIHIPILNNIPPPMSCPVKF